MKFLIVNTDYPEFLYWLYTHHPGLEKQPHEEQMRIRVESLFGVADFYSSNLRKLGHEAWDIHANNEFMQKAWAREHSFRIKEPVPVMQRWQSTLQQTRHLASKTPLRYLKLLFRPLLRSLDSQQEWFYAILAEQIKYYKPDILLNQAMGSISIPFLQKMKPYVRLLVGQIASPLPQGESFGWYDLVVSSLPNFVDYFHKLEIPSELNRLAFEPRVLKKLHDSNRTTIPVSFVGSLSRAHIARIRWLEYLCQQLPIKIWGIGTGDLPKHSAIHPSYMGKTWGIEMYQILHNSNITLNHHIDVAGPYANNMRLYEATGVGTLLITDYKDNLSELFVPNKEVVVYHTPEECVELIQYYLEHDEKRETIARAGQKRILKEYTYYQRMQELVNIVYKYI